ncbi:NUDIX hydrolase [Aquimarina sp. 2201CG1-2-11]|uniref:NUDIX hydrolase n=1 Tax=Aquimarina discodermiae TaxID=3231043 RepID=UPI0034635CAD
MKTNKNKEKSRLIVYQGDELMVLQKRTHKLKYGLVGGFLKEKESPEIALIRETYEETLVELSRKDLNYQCSIMIRSKNKHKFSKHYFTCYEHNKPYVIAEPHKFRKIEWVNWKDAIAFLSKSDSAVVTSLFKPCKLIY